MATIVTDLHCDLTQNVKPQFLHGNLFSQDNAANTINVHVFNGGEPAALGGSISANVIRSDGATVAVSGAIEGNKAYIILPQACYAVPGVIKIIIKNTESTTVTTIAAVVANVYASSTDTVVDPGQIIPSVAALIAQIEAAVDSIPVDYSGLLATIAADYSSSKTYPIVGMYAWQGGVLKRNIVPITTAETYTAAHWTNAVIGDDLSALKSAIQAEQKGTFTVPTTYNYIANASSWVTGSGVRPSDGQNQSSDKQCRTPYVTIKGRTLLYIDDPDYEFVVWEYTGESVSSAVFSPNPAFSDSPVIITEEQSATKFRLGVHRKDNADIAEADITALTTAVKTFLLTDDTLSVSGSPADAKKTGDEITALSGKIGEINTEVFLPDDLFDLSKLGTTSYPTGLRNGRWNTSGKSKTSNNYVRTAKSFAPADLADYSEIIINNTSGIQIQAYWSTEGFPYGENDDVTNFGYSGDYVAGPLTVQIDHSKYYTFSLNVAYSSETISTVASNTVVKLVRANSRIDKIDDEYIKKTASVCGDISVTPAYSIPVAFQKTENVIEDSETINGTKHDRIQGICSDGRRYLYYCLLNSSGVGAPCKFDTLKNERVLIESSLEHDYGHCEDMAFVPAWMSGFDNGNVDRIYIPDGNRTDTHSLIHVIRADNLTYITSFATDELPPAETIGAWWEGADHVWCCPELGKFAIESIAIDPDNASKRLNCVAIYGADGTLEKAVKFTRTGGTEFGNDCDGNYLFLGRYISGDSEGQFTIYEHMLDWDLNPVRIAQVTQAAWEIEGMCHIGQDIYFSYIEDSSAKGASIYRYSHVNDKHPTGTTFPLSSPIVWSSSAGFPLNSFEVVNLT